MSNPITRRGFVKALGLGAALAPAVRTRPAATGFFRVERRGGRWWLVDPEGAPFFSLGLNHIDPATLRAAESGRLWHERYGNSMRRWLEERVRPDLQAWGFNTAGWVQDVVTRGFTNHRHSRSFTYEEYGWLGLPYGHMLPFADFHHWEAETRHPDLFSQDFEDWCDYVARDHCTRFADDPKLIGYFLIDCPTWVHTRDKSAWKGPLFDPERLGTPEGDAALFRLATRYYRVTHDAIRRYDPHHLILGDRYEARRPMSDVVLRAARPYVDVLSFQHFGEPADVAAHLHRRSEQFGMPVLLADSGVPDYSTWEQGYFSQDLDRYRGLTQALPDVPGCVGFHFCGAYLRNRVRKYGLRDEREQPDVEAIEAITAANRSLHRRMATLAP